jgi:hypothetical protein
MNANYLPGFGAKILKQVVALIGWSDIERGLNVITRGGDFWGFNCVKSQNYHSTGKRHLRVYLPGSDGSGFYHEFGFGLSSVGVRVDHRPLAYNEGDQVGFYNRITSNNRTGVVHKFSDSGGDLTHTYDYQAGGAAREGWYFDVLADFDGSVVEFVAFDFSGVELFAQSVVLPESVEFSAFVYNELNRDEQWAVNFDFTGDTFDVAPGYKAWDAL